MFGYGIFLLLVGFAGSNGGTWAAVMMAGACLVLGSIIALIMSNIKAASKDQL